MSEKNSEPEIFLDDVSFSYPGAKQPSVSHVTLKVQPGEFVVLTGGSGSGKTTLTRIVNGLAEQFYEGKLMGEARVFGPPVSSYPLSEVGRQIGSIFQDPKSQFFASITEDEVAFGCENYGVAREELERRVNGALKSINGDNLRGRQIYPMSSGEKQKVAIASINAVNPKIYVFDEPSANLDMRSVESLRGLMTNLKNQGHTILVSEHRLYYLMGLADRFLRVKQGKVLQELTPAELCALDDTERRKMGLRAPDLLSLSIPHFEQEALPDKKDMTAAAVLEVKQVSYAFRKHMILDQVSLKVEPGSVTALVGHNGVGKTTLAEIICGVRRATSGEVLLNGTALRPVQRRKDIYFVMQETDCQLFGDSLFEELALNRGSATDQELNYLLEAYGLAERAQAHPATLSGGQRQRLTLAVCELMNTPIIILDEPTSGLDFGNMMRISERLRLLARRGHSILVITHDYEFAAMTCTQVAYMENEGKIEEFPVEGNLKRLYECLTKDTASISDTILQ